MKDFDKKARAYALKNAVSHGGKAVQGSVISSLFNEGLRKDDVKKYAKKISEIVNDVNSLTFEDQEKEFESLKEIISERQGREGLADLPGAKEGKVVMRFAPSASGPLHVGHALTASISYLYVKKYGGKFYVRIEDTNPDNIYKPAYKMIEKESDWLFDNDAEILIQSYRMDMYYKYAEKMIGKNSAYVCVCSSEKFEKHVKGKTDCPCRNLSQNEIRERWKKMLDKTKNGYKKGEAVLRFKSDMNHPNPAMRDFPLARVNDSEHPLQKKKYKVWPLMNLAVAVDDIETKITHTIRAKDHRDNAKRQEMIFDVLGKKPPWTSFLGRIKFKDLKLSTSEFRKGIEEGKFSGWDDERLPTIESLRKQGYKPSSFWKFSEQIGLSENDKVIDKKEFFTLLNSFNRL